MQDLIKDCTNLRSVINEAVAWTNNNLAEERRKTTVYHLDHLRRLTKRYESSSGRKPSVALYGQSQAGKSYLVSNLAKPESSKTFWVEVPWLGKKYDFINDINPFGKEKESTGLVTRFTLASESKKSSKFSFLLKTFRQADLVSILANAYFSNIGKKIFKIDKEDVLNTINELKNLERNPDNQNEFSSDDIFEIKEYVDERFLGSKSAGILEDLNSLEFFESLSTIIPFIRWEERWKAFQFLWGKHKFYSDLFNILSDGLSKLAFSSEVFVAENGLIPRENSIIDVTRYYGILDKSSIAGNPMVEVETSDGKTVTVDRSVLSGIVSEIVLYIPQDTANELPFLQTADILDFPGARPDGDMDEEKFIADNNTRTNTEHYLRGKLNFLFDRYNRDYEISNLILCWPIKQPNVIKIRKLINEWIKNNVGRTPEKREERLTKLQNMLKPDLPYRINPFLVVMTMFDEDLKVKAGEDPASPARWESRFKENYNKWLQHEVDAWLDNWDTAGTFSYKHTFPIRDPKYSNEIFDGYETMGYETAVRDEYKDKLNTLKESFINYDFIKKHLLNPVEAWDELLSENVNGGTAKGYKTGIHYVLKYISPVCNDTIKHEQLTEKISELRTSLLKELEQYFEGGDINEKLKKARTNGLKTKVAIEKLHDEKYNFGLFLKYLTCPEELAWKEYWKLMNEEVLTSEGKSNGSSKKNDPQIVALQKLLDRKNIQVEPGKTKFEEVIQQLMEAEGVEDAETLYDVYNGNGYELEKIRDIIAGNTVDTKADEADIFARNLISSWLYSISIAKSEATIDAIGLPKPVAEMIFDQLTRNIVRVDLRKKLAALVRDEIKAYHVTQNQNFDLVSRLACNLLNSFITTTGWIFIEPDKRPKTDKGNKAIFTYADNAKFPKKKELNFSQKFPGFSLYESWKIAIRDSFEANVLYENNLLNAEKAIANQKLGEIIKKVKG
jgi:hypothetical protein